MEREPIPYGEISTDEVIMRMAEGSVDAVVAMNDMAKHGAIGLTLIKALDEWDIRGKGIAAVFAKYRNTALLMRELAINPDDVVEAAGL